MDFLGKVQTLENFDAKSINLEKKNCLFKMTCKHHKSFVTPQTQGSVYYPSTRGIQVDVGLPDATSENRAESPLYGELYPSTILA